MQYPLGSLRLLATYAFALWHLGAATSHASYNSSVLNGNQAVNVSVGCHADVAYPTQHKDKPDHATKPRFTHVFENPIAEFLSLHFKQFDLPDDDYIVLRPTDASKQKLSVKYLGKDTRGAFFSKALYTTSVTLELYSNGTKEKDDNGYGFAIDKYRFLADAASFEKSSQEVVCGADDTGEAACFRSFPDVYRRSEAVARLLIHKDGASYFCTGWLVGCEGHVMTNHHCISNSLHAANTEFEFLGQGKSCADRCNEAFACGGKTRATTARLVVANENLDYALIKVEGKLHREYGYLQMREGGATLNEPIYMPQHPAGWGKRIGMKDGDEMAKVAALDRTGCLPNQVGYYIDTQGGSSGSPVLSSRDHAVVALHNCGGCPNTGVNVGKIIQDLRDKELLPKCAVYEPPDTPFDRHDHRDE